MNEEANNRDAVGPVPPPGVPVPPPDEPTPRRLRRLYRVWPDRDGNISYLLTMCVDGRTHVLNNEPTFERLVAFLLESTRRRVRGRGLQCDAPRRCRPCVPTRRPSASSRETRTRIHPNRTVVAMAGRLSRPQIPHARKRIAQMGIRLPEPGSLRFG